ncbi:MAG: methyltransferase domain-containing protein [Actinomycetaceae bacterium]|nr:class I SAM-dependent methyltransferase [Arcanobacterium sp.]MDD7505704.1 methyltransferase domain-containing protein [Actinomycetaceae bacterium]
MNNPFENLGGGARAYVDVRPGYPAGAIDELFHATLAARGSGGAQRSGRMSCDQEFDPGRVLRIADIGAGTGKLTADLLAAGEARIELWAVEPAEDMRVAFAYALPHFPPEQILSRTAEDTGLDDAYFDALTYGQCWHWLDAKAAAAEAARILRPGGVIAIFYNQLAVEVPWVKRLTRIMRSGDVHRFDRPPYLGPGFTAPELHMYDWHDTVQVTDIFELGTTRSSWIRSTPENRARMRENLRWYLYDHLGFSDDKPVRLPYHTYLWLARLRCT